MAAELTTTKLVPDSHLFLDQPLLRLPHELARRNFKTSQRYVEREKEYLLPALKETANASLSSSHTPDQAIAALDAMINRMQTFKRKLQTLQDEEQTIQSHSKKRIQHLQELDDIPSLADVKYDQWSRRRLDRLLVDYLLRSGHGKSAELLSERKGIKDLVDLEVFAQCQRIADSLDNGETKEALAWCAENKTALRKLGQNDLEFELRLQQYVEMLRKGSKREAQMHAQKHFAPNWEINREAITTAAALLAFPSDTNVEPYKNLYSLSRWSYLSRLFTQTHHTLLGLPSRPLLHVALSAGLSALKTPSCHSSYASSSANASSTSTSVCPICSIELNDLAVHVPYAHHTKSYVESDPVVLPNGRIYGRERLEEMQRKLSVAMGLDAELVKDPTTGEIFSWSEVKKVFIT